MSQHLWKPFLSYLYHIASLTCPARGSQRGTLYKPLSTSQSLFCRPVRILRNSLVLSVTLCEPLSTCHYRSAIFSRLVPTSLRTFLVLSLPSTLRASLALREARKEVLFTTRQFLSVIFSSPAHTSLRNYLVLPLPLCKTPSTNSTVLVCEILSSCPYLFASLLQLVSTSPRFFSQSGRTSLCASLVLSVPLCEPPPTRQYLSAVLLSIRSYIFVPLSRSICASL